MSLQFDEFISKKLETIPEKSYEDEKTVWLAHLDELYQTTASYLKNYVDKKQITIEYKDVMLYEEQLGSYEAKSQIITIGKDKITLNPIGTFLIGAKGRVEISGKRGEAALVLVDNESKGPRVTARVSALGQAKPIEEKVQREVIWTWKYVTYAQGISFHELTEEQFLDIIMTLIDG
ncbi:MAG: hypothetical protein LBV76_03605 [Deltaproteobacteria bacterium]|jgi:hypothetical protein|nr:hypothetical protein [Deltaproteobacteria bacterium]